MTPTLKHLPSGPLSRSVWVSLLAIFFNVGSLQAANWTGGGDGISWTAGANWNTTPLFPGQTGATDNLGNVRSGAFVQLDNSGGLITQNVTPFVDTGGQLNVLGGTTTFDQLGIGRFGNGAVEIQAGSTVNHTSGGQKVRFWDDPDDPGPSFLRVNGGTFNATTSVRWLMGVGAASDANRANPIFEVSSGVVNGGSWFMDDSNVNFLDSMFLVKGSAITTLSIGTLNAYRQVNNTDGSATVKFEFDASGVKPITAGTVNFLGVGLTGTIAADLSALGVLSNANLGDTYPLINYSSISGFGDAVWSFASLGGFLPTSDGSTRYAELVDSGSSIDLVIVPEPGTFGLFTFLLWGLTAVRSRFRKTTT